MRLLGLDVGERRIGVALSDPSGTVARPLLTLERRSRREDFATLAALVISHGVEQVVVGCPLSLDGSAGPQAHRIARYAEALRRYLSIPLVLWDERYTTVEAEEIVHQKRRRSPDRGEVDRVAAAVILQSYLNSLKESS